MANTEKPELQTCGLSRIAAKARTHRTEKFSSLLHHLTLKRLEDNIRAIPAKTSVGIDGITRDGVLTNLSWLGPQALTSMHKGTYEAPPSRRAYVPKADGSQRPLGVPTVLDRGVQRSVAEILSSIYEEDFLEVSFGFRPNRSCHHAIATLQHCIYYEKLHYALEVDIRDFFGSVDHDWLRQFVRHRVSDERIIKLIDSWLTAGVLEDQAISKAEKGTVQGGSISPLLANIYLHYALDLWFEKLAKHQLRGRARLIRYCDDFVILFENAEDREDFLPLLKVRLGQFKLEIAPHKTHFTDVKGGTKSTPNRRRGIRFLGFCIYWTKGRSGKGSRLVISTESSRLAKAKAALKELMLRVKHQPLANQARCLNWYLRGHFNYYGLPGNNFKLGLFKGFAMHAWRKALSRRSQQQMTWEKFLKIITPYKLAAPHLFITYATLGTYVKL
jgi:RNA-directed DNA polymerase